MTHPIITFRGSHNKVVLSLQSLPLHADSCAMELKLGMAHKTMQYDHSCHQLCVRNNSISLHHVDTTVKSSAIWLVLPTFWRHSRKL